MQDRSARASWLLALQPRDMSHRRRRQTRRHGGAAQDMILVLILRRVVSSKPAIHTVRPHHRSLVGKVDKAFQYGGRALEAFKRFDGIVGAADFCLALAVI